MRSPNATLSPSKMSHHVAHATTFLSALSSAPASPTLVILHSRSQQHRLSQKRGFGLPIIPLFYSSLGLLTLLTHPLYRHESQCLEPSPIRHLIVLLPCRRPFILPYSSESRATVPSVLGYNSRKDQRIFGGP